MTPHSASGSLFILRRSTMFTSQLARSRSSALTAIRRAGGELAKVAGEEVGEDVVTDDAGDSRLTGRRPDREPSVERDTQQRHLIEAEVVEHGADGQLDGIWPLGVPASRRSLRRRTRGTPPDRTGKTGSHPRSHTPAAAVPLLAGSGSTARISTSAREVQPSRTGHGSACAATGP